MYHYAVGPYQQESEDGLTFWRAPKGAYHIDLRSIPGHSGHTFGLFWSPEPFGADYRSFGFGHIAELGWGAGDRDVFASMFGLRTVTGDSLLDGLWDVLTVRSDPVGDDRAKPIMPTDRGFLELHLDGHSRVRRKRFRTDMPEAAAVQQAVRAQYGRARQAGRAGGLGRENQHLRILDALCIKYGVDESWVHPADKRLPHETTIGDTFVDTDSVALTSHTATGTGGGFGWTSITGTPAWTILGNELHHTTAAFNGARADSALSSDDHSATVEIRNVSTHYRTRGVICRKDNTATRTYYAAFLDRDSALENGETWKWVTASLTSIGTDTGGISVSVGDTITLECNGSSIIRKRNGTVQNTATDTAITGNVYCGIESVHGVSGGLIDNFVAADLGGGGGSVIPQIMHHRRMQGMS